MCLVNLRSWNPELETMSGLSWQPSPCKKQDGRLRLSLRLLSVRPRTRELGLHPCFWCTFWRITLETPAFEKKTVLLEVVFDWCEKRKCGRREMEIRLRNRLLHRKCWGHVTVVCEDGVFLLSLEWQQIRVDRWKKKSQNITTPNPDINAPICPLPGRQLVLFGFVSLQSCFGLLPLAPSTDQTSAVYLLQPSDVITWCW